MFLKLRWLTPVHNEVSGRTVTKATFIQVEQNPDGSPHAHRRRGRPYE